jgi:hypothetical protein
MITTIFLNGRLEEPDFELTKPSTGQTNRKEKLGIPIRDASTKCEELKTNKRKNK